MSDDVGQILWERCQRAPRGGLVAITMDEVAWAMSQRTAQDYQPKYWGPPSKARTSLFGVDAIVIDHPPLPVPPT